MFISSDFSGFVQENSMYLDTSPNGQRSPPSKHASSIWSSTKFMIDKIAPRPNIQQKYY